MAQTDLRNRVDRTDRSGPPVLYGVAARGVSLLAAGLFSLVLTLYPHAVVSGAGAPDHAELMVCLWGIAGGYVHGVGFVPRNPVLRIVLGPVIAWLLMLGGIMWMAGG